MTSSNCCQLSARRSSRVRCLRSRRARMTASTTAASTTIAIAAPQTMAMSCPGIAAHHRSFAAPHAAPAGTSTTRHAYGDWCTLRGMARLAPSEVAEVVERVPHPATVGPPDRRHRGAARHRRPFVRHQLGDVRVDDHGWIATAQWEGIAVTGTPRLGVLAQPAVIPWGDVARSAAPGPDRGRNSD